jgi:hypothetical protein
LAIFAGVGEQIPGAPGFAPRRAGKQSWGLKIPPLSGLQFGAQCNSNTINLGYNNTYHMDILTHSSKFYFRTVFLQKPDSSKKIKKKIDNT